MTSEQPHRPGRAHQRGDGDHPGRAHELGQARRQDSERRRQRVLNALTEAAARAETVTLAGIARSAGVHRTFLYRHPDLHAAVLAQAAGPPASATSTPTVSHQSLLADLANLQARNTRYAQTITTLERRLSEALGEATWKASGLGAPDDAETLRRRISELEQDTLTLRGQLSDQAEELQAARTANRDLMTRLNRGGPVEPRGQQHPPR